MPKHYSFDLWLTLIKSNPEFKSRRDLMFFELFNPSGLSKEEVSAIIRKVDVKSNHISEITELHVPCERMIYDILHELNFPSEEITHALLLMIFTRIQSLFLEYPPVLYDENTLSTLEQLHEQGCQLNILSNTGFITGATLNKVLVKLGIKKFFNFSLYSDNTRLSKPNVKMFDLVKDMYFDCVSIIHVGDNPMADGACINNPSFSYFQINSNHKTIIDLLQ